MKHLFLKSFIINISLFLFFYYSEFIHLFYFNKTENDIWLKKQFDELQKNDLRLVVRHILSAPESIQYTGDRGRITKELVENVAESSNFVFVCGPHIFNEIATQLITECKIEMHCFQG